MVMWHFGMNPSDYDRQEFLLAASLLHGAEPDRTPLVPSQRFGL